MQPRAWPLRALTYNVHGCIGRDGVHDIERCVAITAHARADVIGLQEVDSRDGRDMWRAFEDDLGLHAVPGPTLRGGQGHYGNLLLSRHPCTSVRHHDLSVARREPRRAIEACLETPQGRLRVIVTHLGLRAAERAEQARRLGQVLAQDRGAAAMLVLGDFNEWRRPRQVGPRLHGGLVTPALPRSFPSNYPMFALDQVWCQPAGLVTRVEVLAEGAARVASDHLPVLASGLPVAA